MIDYTRHASRDDLRDEAGHQPQTPSAHATVATPGYNLGSYTLFVGRLQGGRLARRRGDARVELIGQ